VNIDMRAADIGSQIIRAYLSPQHLKEIENACPMVALPSDVARSGESAKRAYEAVFKAMVAILEQGALGTAKGDRRTALAIAALCVGGMVTARAIDDRQLADELLDSARSVALTLGGWSGNARPEPANS
jgi:TetR/AcrR family transcriptional repressor of nem operon